MAEKPSDYFLGALDFFGILVPGAVSLALLIVWYPAQVETIATAARLGSGRIVAFAVVAYLLGYLVNTASTSLTRISDPFWQLTFQRSYGRSIIDRARELMHKELPDEDLDLIGSYRWALASVRYLSPSWATDLDRMTAHTALFRSMTLVITFTAIVELVHTKWMGGVACLILAACSVSIYQKLRWKNIQTVYEYYIALHALSKHAKPLPDKPSTDPSE